MGVIQGLDTIPVRIQKDFIDLFKERLPGWSGTGEYTDLSVAMANDVGLAELASATAAAMTSYDLRTLAQANKVLGKWGASLELTRERRSRRVAAVCNDNESIWREAPFPLRSAAT